jgi:predicted sulfurtransferase
LKSKVRIKQEIVSLRKKVDIAKGTGTHVKSGEWNRIISDKNTVVLDTRNDYEVEIGTFLGAINPNVENSAICLLMSPKISTQTKIKKSPFSAPAESDAKNLLRYLKKWDSRKFISSKAVF